MSEREGLLRETRPARRTLRKQITLLVHFGLTVALILAGFLSSYLRRITLSGSGASGIRLAGATQMAMLAALAYVLIPLRRLPKLVIPFKNPGFIGFIVLNFAALGIGLVKYDLYDVLIDGNWMVWIGFYFVVTARASVPLIKKLGITLYLISILRCVEGFANVVSARGTLFLTTGGQRFISGSGAAIVAAGFIVSFVLLLFRQRSRGRLLLGAVALLQLLGLVISFNRQTWVALAVALLVGFVVAPTRRRVQLLILITFLFVVLLVVVLDPLDLVAVDIWGYLLDRIGIGQDLGAYIQDSAIQFRFSAWRAAVKGIMENPILGKGWGAPLMFTHGNRIYNMSPHNTYLWIAYKAGIPALLLFVGFMTSLLFRSLQRYFQWARRGVRLSVFLIASVLIQISFLVGALWWDYFTVMYLSVPIWINTGILYVLPFLQPDGAESGQG